VQRAPCAHDPVVSHYPKPTPMPRWQPTKSVWPSGSADAVLAPDRAQPRTKSAKAPPARKTQAGKLPVWISAATATPVTPTPRDARQRARDRRITGTANAAGVNGVLLSLGRDDGTVTAGSVHVSLSYAGFQDAFAATGPRGSPWCAARLRGHHARRSGVPWCRRRSNSPTTSSRTLDADVTLPAASQASSSTANLVLARVRRRPPPPAPAAGTTPRPRSRRPDPGRPGQHRRVHLEYPIPVPGVPGSLTPKVQLGLRLPVVDGLTTATNIRPRWSGTAGRCPSRTSSAPTPPATRTRPARRRPTTTAGPPTTPSPCR